MRALLLALPLTISGCAALTTGDAFQVASPGEMFAPGIVSTEFSDVRLTISPDGRTALWFSRNRPGGPGGYDIWISRKGAQGWSAATPVPFNSSARDFDPAFTADGRYVYFCSDRAGGVGGDDLWRVRVTARGFAAAEPLGAAVNSARNEWAPMVSPDGRTLLFSSDGHAGAGRMDLFTSLISDAGFGAPEPLPGSINTAEDEFDATFLADGRAIVFSRARNLREDAVRLFHSVPRNGSYTHGALLPPEVNTADSDTYAPMLDWSRRRSLTFTTRRPADSPRGVDVYVVKYRD
jgi:Tol biopolymer transport system component